MNRLCALHPATPLPALPWQRDTLEGSRAHTTAHLLRDHGAQHNNVLRHHLSMSQQWLKPQSAAQRALLLRKTQQVGSMSQRSGHQPDSRHDACGHRADWSHDPAVRGRAGLPACWIRAQSRLFPCPRNPATNLTPGTMRPGTEQADPMSLRSGDPPESRMRFVTARYKVVPRIYKPECDLYQHSTNLYLCFISQNGFVPARYKFVPLFYKPK